MKKAILRDSNRKFQTGPSKQKSQSPTHKKLLKKIEQTQRIPTQYDHSLQDDMVFQKPQEEVVDFRVEIERRFNKSTSNHTFRFPLSNLHKENLNGGSDSSDNSSFESIRHVTVYDLAVQNKKRAKPAKPILRSQEGMRLNQSQSSRQTDKDRRYVLNTETDYSVNSDSELEESNSGVPIEVRIRDKSSSTYKKLINLLERQLNKDDNSERLLTENKHVHTRMATQQNENIQPANERNVSGYRKQASSKEPKKEVSKERRPLTTGAPNPYTKTSKLFKYESQRTLGSYHVGKVKLREGESKIMDKSESMLSFHDAVAQKLKKNSKAAELSQRLRAMQNPERSNRQLETSHNNEQSLISLDSRLSPNAKKTLNDLSKISQESKKKVYNVASVLGNANVNGLIKALTPKYLSSKNLSNWNEKNDKLTRQSTQPDSLISTQNPSTTLYQKVQGDVLNAKLAKTSSQKSTKRKVDSANEILKTDKDETYKPVDVKGINFTDFYGSPKSQAVKSPQSISHSVYNKVAAKRDVRKEASIGNKSAERQSIYNSYDIGRKAVNRPAFKLDLSARMKDKTISSSSRIRSDLSKEKPTDMLSIDSILKGSYDMHNHSLVRSVVQKAAADALKKKVGAMPKGLLVKNR